MDPDSGKLCSYHDHTRQVENAKFFFCVAVAMHLKLFSVSRVKTSL